MHYGVGNYCEICLAFGSAVDGCVVAEWISKDGLRVTHRVKYGHAAHETAVGDLPPMRCVECSAKLEEFHHVGCPAEICALCARDLRSCACGWDTSM